LLFSGLFLNFAVTKKIKIMDTILSSVKTYIRSDAKMNKGVCNCVECDFKAPDNFVVPYMTGIAPNTNWGAMVVWECPKCFLEQFFHYRGGKVLDYQSGYIAYKLSKNVVIAREAALQFANKEYTDKDVEDYVKSFQQKNTI